eukprot:499036-Rhodomonas_salina.2
MAADPASCLVSENTQELFERRQASLFLRATQQTPSPLRVQNSAFRSWKAAPGNSDTGISREAGASSQGHSHPNDVQATAMFEMQQKPAADQISELHRKLEESKQQTRDAKAASSSLEKEKEALQLELDNMRAKNATLLVDVAREIAARKEVLGNVDRALQLQQEAITREGHAVDITSEITERNKLLEQHLEAKTAQVFSLTADNEKLKADNQELDRLLTEAKKFTEQLQMEKKDIERQLEKEKESIQEKLHSATAAVCKLKREQEALRKKSEDETAALQKKYADEKAALLQGVENQKLELTSELEDMKEQCEKSEQERQNVEQERDNVKMEVTVLKEK